MTKSRSQFEEKARKQLEKWFATRRWKPFPFQTETWQAYLDGKSGLVHAATGTGKTMSVWLGPILQESAKLLQNDGEMESGLKVLWITPLRALAGDTVNALQTSAEQLGVPWRVQLRTSDVGSSAKAKQRKDIPDTLVTTPESLTILLTYEDFRSRLTSLRCVVVDEWHELLGTKRGVQTELALARLRKFCPELRVWGISATLGNLEQALATLVGPERSRDAVIVQGDTKKETEIASLLPAQIERFPWAGHSGGTMVGEVVGMIDQAKNTLVFTNTRSQTEVWYQAILKTRPDWAGMLAIHHGSLDTSVRQWVEERLRAGDLKAVVCTSSLDLGVDYPLVEQVLQVGSPKGIARLVQRAGRSGHRPGVPSRLTFVPTHALELVELAAARRAMHRRQIEARLPENKPLDVLVQHAVTCGIEGSYRSEELLAEVRDTTAFESLTDAEWEWVLKFCKEGGESLHAYPEFHRLQHIDDQYCVTDKRTVRQHRMSIGTITSDAEVQVQYLKGSKLGSVEETFAARLKPGDRFLLAGKLLELVRVRDNTAYVKKARGNPTAVPRWMGGRMPLSSELSAAMREELAAAARGEYREAEMEAVKPLLVLQQKWSRLPSEKQLLVEQLEFKKRHLLLFYPMEGRLVHEGLAALLALRLSRIKPITFSIAINDYGLLLESVEVAPLEELKTAELFSIENLESDIGESLNSTEMAKRHFREIARISGMIHSGFPGRSKTMRYLQASSNLFYDVFAQFEPDSLLLQQSRREALEKQLEWKRLMATMQRLESLECLVERPKKPTPLAFPLIVERMRERLSSETLADRVLKMQQQLEIAAAH
ncbi:MAG: ligase-associated DNA damage response DEXH box helicase [Planctomycetes bacterium]|nr:ligase-associated DNA damage response DEXH box helicase [Planctomycetota bacterium]